MALHRNKHTGKIYEVVGLVVDSNKATRGAFEAEVLYRPVPHNDAIFYRRKKSEFTKKFKQVLE